MRRIAILALLAAASAHAHAQEPTSKPSIPLEEFVQRRQRLLAQFPGAVLVIEADPLAAGMSGIDTNTPKFDFFYLTGYHAAGDLLAMNSVNSEILLFTNEDRAKLAAKTGIRDVLPQSRFSDFVRELAGGKAEFRTRLRREALKTLQDRIAGTGARVQPAGQEIQDHLTRARQIKSPAELDMIRKASDATNKAHLAAMKACHPGLNEKDLQKVIEDKFRAEGCDGLGFPSIVGSGKNGTVLHYNKNKDPIPAHTLLVCDIGASYRGYVTDITRTLPTSGRFSERHRAAYEGVLEAQKAAEALLKPGVTFEQLHEAAAEVLRRRDMTDWSYAHSSERSVRHGLSHFVGLAVHDSGIYREPLRPGMVITIEPGYYNIEEKFGIRIEDIYIVTEQGFERLSASAPREAAEIEKMMERK